MVFSDKYIIFGGIYFGFLFLVEGLRICNGFLAVFEGRDIFMGEGWDFDLTVVVGEFIEVILKNIYKKVCYRGR